VSTSNFVCTTYYDERFAPLGDLCLRSLRYYAAQHGVELAYLPDVAVDRPPPWRKLLITQQLFQRGHEYVMWVDADALVVDATRSPRDMLEEDKDFYLVGHHDGKRLIPNTGVFVARNCEWTLSFFDQVWQLEQYIDHPWWENAAVTHLLRDEDFSDLDIAAGRQVIDDERVKWLGVEWNSIPEVQDGRFASADPVIKHWAGFSMKQRRRGMLKDFHRTPIGQQSAPAAKDLIRALYSSDMPRPC